MDDPCWLVDPLPPWALALAKANEDLDAAQTKVDVAETEREACGKRVEELEKQKIRWETKVMRAAHERMAERRPLKW